MSPMPLPPSRLACPSAQPSVFRTPDQIVARRTIYGRQSRHRLHRPVHFIQFGREWPCCPRIPPGRRRRDGECDLQASGHATITATDVGPPRHRNDMRATPAAHRQAFSTVTGFPATTAGIARRSRSPVADNIGQLANRRQRTRSFSLAPTSQAGLPGRLHLTAADAGRAHLNHRNPEDQPEHIRHVARLLGSRGPVRLALGISVQHGYFPRYRALRPILPTAQRATPHDSGDSHPLR